MRPAHTLKGSSLIGCARVAEIAETIEGAGGPKPPTVSMPAATSSSAHELSAALVQARARRVGRDMTTPRQSWSGSSSSRTER